ncbi:hypothetical protein HKD37_06G016536 [Glycine soja]
MDEHQQNWKEMANTMLKINKKAENMFNIFHVIDQSNSRSFAVRLEDELEEFYGLTGNHQVTLTHYGQSVFLLTIFKSTFEPKAYPKWHSLYHQVPNSVTFKVLLTEYKVTCNNLVSN